MSYLKGYINYTPHQRERLDEKQVKNAAGGYVYEIPMMDRVKRFLVMGTEGGTYYEDERELTKQNLDNLKQALKEKGVEVIEMAREVSVKGQASKNDQAIFTLCLGMTIGDEGTKKAVERVFNEVVRTGSHLLMAVSFIDEMRGWGRVPRRIVGNWYLNKEDDALAYQVAKYRNRNGWTHKDVLRRVRQGRNTPLYRWMVGANKYTARSFERRVGGPVEYPDTEHVFNRLPRIIDGIEAAQHMAQEASIAKPNNMAQLIKDYKLTHEMVPNSFLKHPKVWEALLADIPLMALMRNLGRITSIGMVPQMSDTGKAIADKFTPERVKKARLHPLQILTALKIYEMGKGMRGSLEWTPNSWILNRLGEAFYWSFESIEPINKPVLLAIDVSASMFGARWRGSTLDGPMRGSPLTPGEIAAVMAMVTARVEPYHHICAFDHRFVEMPITAQQSLTDVMKEVMNRNWGATDCALPMLEANKRKWHNIEGFVIYTDNETWRGTMHPKQALDEYRKRTGLDSRLAVSAMTATDTSISDLDVPYMGDFVGFSPNTPRVMNQFLAGEV